MLPRLKKILSKVKENPQLQGIKANIKKLKGVLKNEQR